MDRACVSALICQARRVRLCRPSNFRKRFCNAWGMSTRLAKPALTFCIGCAFLGVEAAPPANYYDSAQGKTGAELRQALHSLIKGHTVILYDSSSNVDSVDALKVLDEDPASTNNVVLIYSGFSVPKANYGVNGWNREHLWPNSYGFDIDITTTWPALRDLFNLSPCDSGVNSARGNKYYDYSDPTDPNYKKPAHASAPLCSTDTDSWEPPDSMKGDIARAMFYMDVRYAGESSSEPDLVLTDNVGSITNGSPFMGRLSALLSWHQLDPVDASEQKRNDLIYDRYQRNRNPFLDHPEWVASVFAVPVEPRLTMPELGTNAVLRFMIVGGSAGQTNVVQASADLVTWFSVSTNVFPATVCAICPFIVFQDSVADSRWRFYRAFTR